jgi:hypothetical protein
MRSNSCHRRTIQIGPVAKKSHERLLQIVDVRFGSVAAVHQFTSPGAAFGHKRPFQFVLCAASSSVSTGTDHYRC